MERLHYSRICSRMCAGWKFGSIRGYSALSGASSALFGAHPCASGRQNHPALVFWDVSKTRAGRSRMNYPARILLVSGSLSAAIGSNSGVSVATPALIRGAFGPGWATKVPRMRHDNSRICPGHAPNVPRTQPVETRIRAGRAPD